jgi:hypothetical protein
MKGSNMDENSNEQGQDTSNAEGGPNPAPATRAAARPRSEDGGEDGRYADLAPGLIYGVVSLGGITAIGGIPWSQFVKGAGVGDERGRPPAQGIFITRTLVRNDGARTVHLVSHVRQTPKPAGFEISFNDPGRPQGTGGNGYALRGPGAYFVVGGPGLGKSVFCRAVAARAIDLGYRSRYYIVGEPDGDYATGADAEIFSRAVTVIARSPTPSLFVIDSLTVAGIYGDALAKGGFAKSVYALGGVFHEAAIASGSLVLLALNPLGAPFTESEILLGTGLVQGAILPAVDTTSDDRATRITPLVSQRPSRQPVRFPSIDPLYDVPEQAARSLLSYRLTDISDVINFSIMNSR